MSLYEETPGAHEETEAERGSDLFKVTQLVNGTDARLCL